MIEVKTAKTTAKPVAKPTNNKLNKLVQKPVAKSAIVKSTNNNKPAEKPVVKPTLSKRKKYTLEYVIKSSPVILYEFLTTPSLMAEWFADEVDSFKNEYSFTWEGQTQKAKVLDEVENEFIRFHWLDGAVEEYLEFRISSTEITGDTVLTITDFCEPRDEKDSKLLWDSQIKSLTQHLGAI